MKATRKLEQAMKARGCKIIWPTLEGSEGALRVGRGRYPTIVSPDGKVKVAISDTLMFVHKGRAYLAAPEEWSPNEVTIAGIVVDKASRRQGLATATMLILLEEAARLGITLTLEPRPLKEHGDIAAEALRQWYKRLGFVGHGAIMTFRVERNLK